MNSIGKHPSLIGILLLTILIGGAAGLYFDVSARFQSATRKGVATRQFICPMHTDVVSVKPGNCPKCGMALVSAGQAKAAHECGDNGNHHPGCCAEMNATQSATQLRLPPGHPPINATAESGPALSNAPANSSH